MAKTPREYQKKAQKFVAEHDVSLVDIDCGLGKTLIATNASLEKKLPVLVIAPKAVTRQWVEELLDAGVPQADIFLYDRPTATASAKKAVGEESEYEKEFDHWLNN